MKIEIVDATFDGLISSTTDQTIAPNGRWILTSANVLDSCFCRVTGASTKKAKATLVTIDGTGAPLAVVTAP